MSHYAIIKRQRHWVIPQWTSFYIHPSQGKNKVLKYEKYSDTLMWCVDNVIVEDFIADEIITYWEGEMNQEAILTNEYIEINCEKMKVLSVEKNVNGIITYLVDDLYEKKADYDELLQECNILYDKYSLEKKQTDSNNKQKESWWSSIFRQIFCNVEK